MKKYSGQAIAIIMVVLVVATVVGASLYSRVQINRQVAIETTESRRALEQADSLLDIFISSDLLAVQGAFTTCLGESEENPKVCEFEIPENSIEFKNFLVSNGIDTTVYDTTQWCSDDNDGVGRVRNVISYAGIEDFVQHDVGDVRAINLQGGNIPSNCSVDFAFESVGGGGDPVFTVKLVYMDANGNVKPYAEDDMFLYCLSSSGTCSSSSVEPGDSIERVLTSSSDVLTYNLSSLVQGVYSIYEIRILPLKYPINISMAASKDCEDYLSNYKVLAEVNCKQQERAKMTIIPSERNMGYPTLFDYTIYNAEGVLRPN